MTVQFWLMMNFSRISSQKNARERTTKIKNIPCVNAIIKTDWLRINQSIQSKHMRERVFSCMYEWFGFFSLRFSRIRHVFCDYFVVRFCFLCLMERMAALYIPKLLFNYAVCDLIHSIVCIVMPRFSVGKWWTILYYKVELEKQYNEWN